MFKSVGVVKPLTLVAVCWLSLSVMFSFAQDDTAKEDPAVGRARKTAKMLDDIYKGAIVVVTENYVHDDSVMPAGEAFKLIFNSAKEKGWHEVRLMDASGEPIELANLPETDFEKAAVKKLLAGESFVEEVTEKDGKQYLQVATAIPVVMDKCIMCHENYKDAKPGQAIGAMSYVIPIE